MLKNSRRGLQLDDRNPLSDNARRSGWVGCNILLSEVPWQGRISLIESRSLHNPQRVVKQYKHVSKLKTDSLEGRSWLFDVLACVNKIEKPLFTLGEVYAFRDELKLKHPDNNNIEAKIRQQLQLLRDKGIIEFADRGVYRKL